MPISVPKLPVPAPPTLSAEVKNILDAPPSWLIRWGSLLLLAGIMGLLLAAGFVRYPSLVTGQAVLYDSGRAPSPAQRSVVTVAGAQGHRLHQGQRVLISLNDFPSEKFGQLLGHVVTAPAPVAGNRARVAITLDQGYLSTHGVVLPVAGDSHGTAQIITTDKRVLERLLRL